ncbi:MAG: molecular chaperone DnaJ [Gemmatimonadetes bacterium]|nr:MAG: molecular chaperone DnaJ [Gemmatimonadota bacterium]
MADYYQLLGVARDATAEEIKKAYRKKALEYHPDRNSGSKEAEERFKEITEAYEVLRDPERRAVYDRYGEQGLKSGTGGPGGFDFADAIEVFMRDFGGMGGFGGFEELFGGRRRGGGGQSRRGQTVRVRLPLTLAEVATGVTKRIRVTLLDTCEACEGSGARGDTPPEPCPTCGGSGEERVVQRSAFHQFVSVAPCRTCRGEGRVIAEPCPACHGDGRQKVQREITVEVPPGVTSENFITLRGEGNAGPRGGPRGDVTVLLDVQEDPRFQREGPHLRTLLPITFTQAALGDEVEVPGVDGPHRLEIPAGVQSGDVLRVRGGGLPELNGRVRGDLLVQVHVWTPTDLSPQQRQALEALRAVEDPAPETLERARPSFWERVKEAFR